MPETETTGPSRRLAGLTLWAGSLALLGLAVSALRRRRPMERPACAAHGTEHEPRDELGALTRQLLDEQEEERRILARELHDDVGQALTAIRLAASALADDPANDPALRREILDEIMATADQTVARLRDLSRRLRPPQLDSLGLEAALRGYLANLAHDARARIQLTVAPLPRRPPIAVELACFRIAQQALDDALRRSPATRIAVRVSVQDGTLELEVHDDGHDGQGRASSGRTRAARVTMRERALQVGGSLAVDGGPGTLVRARLPMEVRGGAEEGNVGKM